MAAGRLAGAAKIGVEVGKVISKHKTAKHFEITITDDSLAVQRRQAASMTKPPGRVLRAAHPSSRRAGRSRSRDAYKNLKYVERDFRHIKSDDLDLRPVFHRLETVSRRTF